MTSALDGGEWSTSHPFRFTPSNPLDGGQGGPHSRSERYGEKKNLAPVENLTPAGQPNI
jgi:hypothetical protein